MNTLQRRSRAEATLLPILVGYDRSLNAGSALKWAQREAGYRSAPVRLVYVYEWTAAAVPVPARGSWPDPSVRRETVAAIDEATAAARSRQPEVPLTGTVVDGTVVPALRKLSEQAQLLVLGNRGLGGFTGLQAGSIAVGLAHHSRCPVVVVRGTAPPRHPIVVGVDDSPDSEHAMGFAFDEATTRGVDLVAVRAWQPPPVPCRDHMPAPQYDVDSLADAELRLTDRALRAWQDKYPGVTVRIQLTPGNAAEALIAATADAQLVVVGSHGRGGFAGQPLGSVAEQVIHHAQCPVAVVRDIPGQADYREWA